jgi:hypothetical protein
MPAFLPDSTVTNTGGQIVSLLRRYAQGLLTQPSAIFSYVIFKIAVEASNTIAQRTRVCNRSVCDLCLLPNVRYVTAACVHLHARQSHALNFRRAEVSGNLRQQMFHRAELLRHMYQLYHMPLPAWLHVWCNAALEPQRQEWRLHTEVVCLHLPISGRFADRFTAVMGRPLQFLCVLRAVRIRLLKWINIQGDQKVSVHLMITPLSQHTSFLPHYLAQSDYLAADRQGQGDTRLTLMPSVIPNPNYVIMVTETV